jgi:glycosyltransferase involved in cell wall biosynthesis
MKVLFLTDNFPPEVNAPAARTYEHCKRWAEMGTDVTVITCVPNFPQGRVYEGYRNKLYQTEKVDGIRIIRVWSYITPNQGIAKRTLDYFSFALSSFWAGLFQKTDIIVATSPQFFTTWSGWALAKLKRKPWVFELRDLWPESIKTVGVLRDGVIYDLLEKIELFLYRNADLIVPVTNSFKENLSKREIPAQKQVVIPNGANLDLFRNGKSSNKINQWVDVTNKFVVGYLGTHGIAHGLDFILDCIKEVKDETYHFVFIGDGSEKQKLIAKSKEHDINNVTFFGPVPREEVPEYLSGFDISLVPLKKAEGFKTVIPSKIFETAAMKVPILLGVEGQAQQIVEEFDNGIFYEPENKEDFLLKLKIMKENKELYQQKADNAMKLAASYDRKKLADKMLSVLKTINNGTK